MLTANKLIPAGSGLASTLLRRAATIEIDWDTRQKSRFDATDSQGRHLGIFLPRGQVVRGGDVLVCEDGSLVAVKAKAQAVMVVTICPDHGAPLDLLRAAYHLGNRHVPLELTPTRLQLEPDHVLAEMLRRMGLVVEAVDAPFEPESGAYEAAAPAAHVHGHSHDHDHGHGHGHAHPHDHDHAHGQNHGYHDQARHGDAHGHAHHEGHGPGHVHGDAQHDGHDPGHVHGPGCGHAHE